MGNSKKKVQWITIIIILLILAVNVSAIPLIRNATGVGFRNAPIMVPTHQVDGIGFEQFYEYTLTRNADGKITIDAEAGDEFWDDVENLPVGQFRQKYFPGRPEVDNADIVEWKREATRDGLPVNNRGREKSGEAKGKKWQLIVETGNDITESTHIGGLSADIWYQLNDMDVWVEPEYATPVEINPILGGHYIIPITIKNTGTVDTFLGPNDVIGVGITENLYHYESIEIYDVNESQMGEGYEGVPIYNNIATRIDNLYAQFTKAEPFLIGEEKIIYIDVWERGYLTKYDLCVYGTTPNHCIDPYLFLDTGDLNIDYGKSSGVKAKTIYPHMGAIIPTGELDWNIDAVADNNAWRDANLVGYWNMDDANGTMVFDMSGRGNDANRFTCASYVTTGMYDSNAFFADGSSCGLEVPSDNNLNIPYATISAWVKPYSLTSGLTNAFIASKKNEGNSGTYALMLTKGTATPGVDQDDYCFTYRLEASPSTIRRVCSTVPANRYEWTYLTGTYDGTDAKLYINGVFDNSESVAGTLNMTQSGGTDTFTIGKRNPGDLPFNGLIDEVKVYDRALSYSEIISDFNAFVDARFVNETPFEYEEGANFDYVIVNRDANISYGYGISLDETAITDNPSWGYNTAFIYNFDTNYSDLAGYAATLYPVGDATRTQGLWDTNAIELDGTGDWATVSDFYQIIDGTNATVSAWVYQDVEQGGDSWYGIMSSCSNDGYDFVYCNWMLFIDETTDTIAWMTNDNAATDNYTVLGLENTWEPGEWRHIVGTYNYENDDMSLYVDGELISNEPITADATSNFDENFYVGTFNELGGNFDGKIEDTFLLYDEFTAEEVRELYQKGAWRQDLNTYTCIDSACANVSGYKTTERVRRNTKYDISDLNTSTYVNYDFLWDIEDGLKGYGKPPVMPHTGGFLWDLNFEYMLAPPSVHTIYPEMFQTTSETQTTNSNSWLNIFGFDFNQTYIDSQYQVGCGFDANGTSPANFDGYWRIQSSHNGGIDWNTLVEKNTTIDISGGVYRNIYLDSKLQKAPDILDTNVFVRLQHRTDNPAINRVLNTIDPTCITIQDHNATGVEARMEHYTFTGTTASTSFIDVNYFDFNAPDYDYNLLVYGSAKYSQSVASGVPEFYIDINTGTMSGDFPRQVNLGENGSGSFNFVIQNLTAGEDINVITKQKTTAGTGEIVYEMTLVAIDSNIEEVKDYNLQGISFANTEFVKVATMDFNNTNWLGESKGMASIPYICSTTDCQVEFKLGITGGAYDSNSRIGHNTSPGTSNLERAVTIINLFEELPIQDNIELALWAKTDSGTITLQGGAMSTAKAQGINAGNFPFESGNGTITNPYQLSNCQQLQDVNGYLDANFIFNNSIDCDVTPFNTGYGFIPLGHTGDKFKGMLDGNGFSLTGLYVNLPTWDYVALVGYGTESSTIVDLNVDDVNITGDQYVGGLVGRMEGSIEQVRMTNVYSHGTSPSNTYTGGMVGRLDGNIFQSSVDANVFTRSSEAGGLVGYAYGDFNISQSFSKGFVKPTTNASDADDLGGLVGAIVATPLGYITDSYSTSDVLGDDCVGDCRNYGGIGGYSSNVIITNSYSTGQARARRGAFGAVSSGGLIGTMGTSTTVNNSFAVGLVSTSNGIGVEGGLIGTKTSGTITNSWWDEITTDQNVMCGSGTGCDDTNGITTTGYFYRLTNPPMDTWDSNTTWERYNTYPVLQWQGLEFVPDYNIYFDVVYPNCGGNFTGNLFRFDMTSAEPISGANYQLNTEDHNLTGVQCSGLNTTDVSCQFLDINITMNEDNNFIFFGENAEDGNQFSCVSTHTNADAIQITESQLIGYILLFIASIIAILLLIPYDKKLAGLTITLIGISLLILNSYVSGMENLISISVLLVITTGIYIFMYGWVNKE